MKDSSYRNNQEAILESTGYDCSKLNAEQMDEIGMAFELATNEWESGIREFDSQEDCDCAYVGGAWESLGLGA